MLAVRGELPDLDGALFESVMNRMVDRMRPAKGQAWDTRAHRGADAVVDLCRNHADGDAVTGPRPHLVVEVPLTGPAKIAGIPLPDRMVEALRAQATIEPVLLDDEGMHLAHGRSEPVLSTRRIQAVLRRDGHCRWPGCERRTGLHVHHLQPVSWGGTDDITNLASVCTMHHPTLVPHGPWILTGNSNQPDGLRVVDNQEDQADRRPP